MYCVVCVKIIKMYYTRHVNNTLNLYPFENMIYAYYTHTHTYIYMCMCVCIDVSLLQTYLYMYLLFTNNQCS